MSHYLTRGQVRKLSKRLRAEGRKLPKVGWCQNITDVAKAHEVCHHAKGYTFVGARQSNSAVLAGARTNYQSAMARVKAARTCANLRKLEKSFDRVYNAGQLTVSELRRLDSAIFTRLGKKC